MNRIKKLSINSAGFSLVELMVVVAIIGVLASVAVPNFQKYQARAKQTEAKVQLSSIFTMEKSFIMDQNSYTGCLFDLGFQPGAIGKAYYTIGFENGAANSTSCGPQGNKPCLSTNYSTVAAIADTPCTKAVGNGANFFVATAKTSLTAVPPFPTLTSQGPTVISNTVFKAAAVGNIYSNKNDEWYIDQDKNLVNIINGLN